MPDPEFATVGFLSWVRQGLAATSGVAGGAFVKDGHLSLPITLRLNGAKLSDVPVQLYGPGDVVGIDAREVVRTDPQNLTSSFEPNYFPCIEFDHADFPWMMTPAAADAGGRLQPWLCLVVVRKNSGTIGIDPRKPLPMLECPLQELPDVSEAWAWAHAQVVTGGAVSQVSDALTTQERNISRLLSARRLDEATAYYACVVPTFDVGRKAGLGESFTADDEKALRPAWIAAVAGTGQTRIQLPVYYHWEFVTGVQGDFETLARGLQRRDLPAGIGVHEVDVSTPGWGIGPFPRTAAGAVIQIEGALRIPGRQATPWSDDVRVPFQTALRQALDTVPKPTAVGGPPSVVGPPLYGQWYARIERVPPAGMPPLWFSELNLDLQFRIAAGVGAQVVRFEQEELMTAAWDQLAARGSDDNEQLKRTQLAEEVGHQLVDKHMAQLSPERFLQVTAPIRTRSAGEVSVEAAPRLARAMAATGVRTAPEAIGIAHASFARPELSAAFRRLTRARGPIARRVAARDAKPPAAVDVQRLGGRAVRRLTPAAPAGAQTARGLTALRSAFTTRATAAAVADAQPSGDQSTDLIRFAPSFAQPAYESLRDFFPEMLLPGLDRLPANSITLLETNPRFVEAFMVGLNHEMSRELLWRDYPTDGRGTYFRQFWDIGGRVPPPTTQERSQLADIKPIAEWPAGSHVGDDGLANASASMMVLALRGDLLNRYPRAIVYAVEALWSSAAAGATRTLGTKELYPMFRITRAPDITMLGFAITAAQARGADTPTAAGTPPGPSKDAGWFFVLQEQATEPRFGLDAAADKAFGTKPAQWSDLSWAHLAPNATALQQIVYAPVNGALKGLTLGSAAWAKNSAHVAFIVRQSRFRMAVHARTWLDRP